MSNDERILEVISSMAASISAIQSDMTSMKSDIASMKSDISGLKVGQAKLEAGQAKLESDLNEVKGTVDFVLGSVTRIEHEHGQKLNVIFDGYHKLDDKMSRIEAHVSTQDDVILRRVFPSAMASK
ncbi:hypothetical protein AGMMS49992_14840 [Clostridia bacterium]|nr:hypothetical protein AGMMS49992_14840 [Clostridia bacterium]